MLACGFVSHGEAVCDAEKCVCVRQLLSLTMVCVHRSVTDPRDGVCVCVCVCDSDDGVCVCVTL